jgi:hypothetical protein
MAALDGSIVGLYGCGEPAVIISYLFTANLEANVGENIS